MGTKGVTAVPVGASVARWDGDIPTDANTGGPLSRTRCPDAPPYPPCYYVCSSSPKHSKQERTWVDGIRFLPPVKWGREYKLNDRKAKICTFFVHPGHWIKICTCYNSNRIQQLLQVGMAVPMLCNSCSDLALCGIHLQFLTTAL